MTDNKIIKALEYSSLNDIGGCRKIDALDLINRLKAENEKLRKGFTADADYFASEYDFKIKAEAIKEFAERLKNKASMITYGRGEEHDGSYVNTIYIDNLVKEMMEEKK